MKKRIQIKTACAKWLPLVLVLIVPVALQAQFTFTTNNGALTIIGYTGPGGEVIIPDTTNGLPITSIGDGAFYSSAVSSLTMPNGITYIGGSAFHSCTNLISVTMPNSVTNIGLTAFYRCRNLVGVAVPDAVTSIERSTFSGCSKLTSVTMGNNVSSIRVGAFSNCRALPDVIIPNGVTNLESDAFAFCTNLTGVYFGGNAPAVDSNTFDGDNNATIYYLPGTSGWGPTLAGRPTALWRPQVLTGDDSFGVRTNQFGFNVSWASGMAVAVDACTNPANPVWTPLRTNTLTGDTLYFSDPKWTNHPARFYRLRWPGL